MFVLAAGRGAAVSEQEAFRPVEQHEVRRTCFAGRDRSSLHTPRQVGRCSAKSKRIARCRRHFGLRFNVAPGLSDEMLAALWCA